MNWKDLQKMVRDGDFIEGIYNYCDRWCERCRLTYRCSLYAQDRAEGDEELDLENDVFWKKFESRLSQTREIILEAAREQGIDPEELVQAAQEPERLRLHPGDHPLSRYALDYAKRAKAFFDEESGRL